MALAVVDLLLGLRRRRTPSTLAPHAWALAELQRIEKEASAGDDTLRSQCESLANVLRRYLSLRYQLPAPEQTTEEFRQALHAHPDLPELKRMLVLDLLAWADLVKFAQTPATPPELRARLSQVRSFVQETQASRAQ